MGASSAKIRLVLHGSFAVCLFFGSYLYSPVEIGLQVVNECRKLPRYLLIELRFFFLGLDKDKCIAKSIVEAF